MRSHILFSINTEANFGIRSFINTCLIITPLMALFGWFNMVIRLKLPISSEVFVGPIVLGLLMSLTVSIMNTFNFMKTCAAEQAKIKELNETQLEVILTLSEVAESRCEETGAHIKRVSEYSRLLGQLAGLQEEEVFALKSAAPLHDIGKIGTPDSILLKPDRLTQKEFAIIEKHAEIGYRILADATKPILKAGAIIARSHHEKWDGSGYPQSLQGEAIPIYGRIVAIADVFDALGSDRVYKKSWPKEQILNYFQEQSGKHFDPGLTKLFIENFHQFDTIRKQYE